MHKAEKSADGETFTDIKYNESNTFKMEKKKKKKWGKQQRYYW